MALAFALAGTEGSPMGLGLSEIKGVPRPLFKRSDVTQAVNLYPSVDTVDTLGP